LLDYQNFSDENPEIIIRERRDVEEVEPYDFVENPDFDFENARYKRDVDDEAPTSADDADESETILSRSQRDVKNVEDEQNLDEETSDQEENTRPKRQIADVLPMLTGSATGTILNKINIPLPNVPAKLVSNWFYNATHKIDLLKKQYHSNGMTATSATSKLGYQIITWYYEGMVKTDTIRDLESPIENPVYNHSISYRSPNQTTYYRNDTQTQINYSYNKVPEWSFNGTHLIGAYNRMVHPISDPQKATLVSNKFFNASHQIDFVKNKVYEFASSHYSSNRQPYQVVTWYTVDGFIKTDTFRDIKEPIMDIKFNLGDIYASGTNFTSLYKNVTYERKPEWIYNGTHLMNAFQRQIAYSVPSPVKATIVGNIFNNVTHQVDFFNKMTYPVRNDQGRPYQTITWYFNELIRQDTFYDLEEPIIDPEFDIATMYFKEPNNTYIYKNISRQTYVPPEPTPQWIFNKTHIFHVSKVYFFPISNIDNIKMTENVYTNETHRVDLLRNTAIKLNTFISSSTQYKNRYQTVSWLIDGIVVRTDTYKELSGPIENPVCNMNQIYYKSPNFTHFMKNQVAEYQTTPINDVWIFNGTHKVNYRTKEAHPEYRPVAPSLPPMMEKIRDEFVFNGTHKVNYYTKEAYPTGEVGIRAPPAQLPTYVEKPRDEWTFNGTHKVNYYTKEAYPTGEIGIKPPPPQYPTYVEKPRDEWIFNGTHKVNYYKKEAYPTGETGIKPPPPPPVYYPPEKVIDVEIKKSEPIAEWYFNDTHKINMKTNEVYTRQPPVQPPLVKDEWIFNGTHKINLRTNEAYPTDPIYKPAMPYLPPSMPTHREEWIFNGTHKVNLVTKEAYPTGEVGIKPPPPVYSRPPVAQWPAEKDPVLKDVLPVLKGIPPLADVDWKTATVSKSNPVYESHEVLRPVEGQKPPVYYQPPQTKPPSFETRPPVNQQPPNVHTKPPSVYISPKSEPAKTNPTHRPSTARPTDKVTWKQAPIPAPIKCATEDFKVSP
jgi:hypothetical protein